MLSALFIYAIKSAICLALLYIPYILLMRRDTFYSMNRVVLLCILVLSVVLPAIQLPIFDNSFVSTLSGDGRAIIEVGLPQIDMSYAEKPAAAVSPEGTRQELSALFVRILLLILVIIFPSERVFVRFWTCIGQVDAVCAVNIPLIFRRRSTPVAVVNRKIPVYVVRCRKLCIFKLNF